MSGVWTGRQSGQTGHCEGRSAEYKRCTYIQRPSRRVRAHADYRWSAGMCNLLYCKFYLLFFAQGQVLQHICGIFCTNLLCAGSSGRRIRDTLLDNVDTASAAGNEGDAQENAMAAAKPQNGAEPMVEEFEVPEQPRSAPQDERPAGKASAVQAGAAWDKARPNGRGDCTVPYTSTLASPLTLHTALSISLAAVACASSASQQEMAMHCQRGCSKY